jgi:hypothetical protein
VSGEVIGKRTTLDAAAIGGTANSRVWWPRFGLLAVGMTATYIVVIGAPIAIIPNPLFHPVTPAGTWSYVSWLLPAAMFGPLLAAFFVPWPQTGPVDRRLGDGGLVSFLAVSCPVRNKLVVVAVGISSGALDYFRPLQPLLGGVSLALLGLALWAGITTLTRAAGVPPHTGARSVPPARI